MLKIQVVFDACHNDISLSKNLVIRQWTKGLENGETYPDKLPSSD